MENNNDLNLILDFIDENIKSVISIEQLSKVASFSVSHFYRLFKKTYGCAPIEYVLKRRLYFAAKELICSKYRIIDIAFEYNFESHDVFTRAFKRIYNITPDAFRRFGYCLPDFNVTLSNNFNKEIDEMHYVEIVTLPKTYLIGVENCLNIDEWAPDVFERMYNDVFKNVPNRVHPDKEGYDPPYTHASHIISVLNSNGSYNYFAGIEVTDFSQVPKAKGVVCRVIPETMCAMVGYEGGLDFRTVAGYLYGEWLEKNNYIAAHDKDMPYCPIEWYSSADFDIYEERIYMPIKPFAYDIEKISGYNGVYYRTVSDDRCKVKEPTFDVMFKWANDNNLFENQPLKFEVRYGELQDKKYYCEVLYKTEKSISNFINNQPVEIKAYPGGLYAKTTVLHHSLEQYGRSFARMLSDNQKYAVTGGCYEEYILFDDKLDYFTAINMYEGIKRK